MPTYPPDPCGSFLNCILEAVSLRSDARDVASPRMRAFRVNCVGIDGHFGFEPQASQVSTTLPTQSRSVPHICTLDEPKNRSDYETVLEKSPHTCHTEYTNRNIRIGAKNALEFSNFATKVTPVSLTP